MSRNLVVCCDGTANKFGAENTSVVRIVEVLKRDDPDQLVFYDPGVGTLPGDLIRDKIRNAIDLAFATGLARNVEDAYVWLMENWRPDDRIYIFGFSRGAYTARVIAAMLHHIGLLPSGSENLIPYALRLLRSARKSDDSQKVGDQFRRTFARATGDPERRVRTHFIGVWDTVSSVGWFWDPVKYRYSATNPSAQIIRHAVAVDERRAFFRQNRMFKPKENPAQDLEQLWFAGVHSDVGGGYSDTTLWRCSFDWMIAAADKAGLAIDDAKLAKVAPPLVDPDPWNGKQHESLKKWWILAEFFPKLHWNGTANEVHFNLFRTRKLKEGELLHSSTLKRIRGNANYKPKNLSKPFRDYVKNLSTVPDVLAYIESPVAAPTGLTPATP
jgi:uncharacterized protein (DUF2235 family)